MAIPPQALQVLTSLLASGAGAVKAAAKEPQAPPQATASNFGALGVSLADLLKRTWAGETPNERKMRESVESLDDENIDTVWREG